MKKVLRYIRKALFFLIVGLLSYGLVGLILTFIPINTSTSSCEKQAPIYVSSNGIHLYFIVPRTFLEAPFVEKLPLPEAAKFVYLGWGERDFYRQTPRWSDLSPGVALKAALWPTASAMHVSYYTSGRDKWKKVMLCSEQQAILRDFIQSSFDQTEEQFEPLTAEGYGSAHFFFEAEGSYSALYTCNTWVNRGLQKAGVRTSLWTPFDFGVLHHLDRIK